MTADALGATVEPLAGYTVGVTAARRAEELGALLERRGAEVLHAPAIRIVPLRDDPDKLARFTSFVNAPDAPDPSIEFVDRRGQRIPVPLGSPRFPG